MILHSFKLFTEYSLANCLNNNKILKLKYLHTFTFNTNMHALKNSCLFALPYLFTVE